MKASLVACIPLAILTLPGAAAPSYISATDFGAVGDGGTDNTAALQRAFDYAKANNMQVYIQPGNYAHSGVIRAPTVSSCSVAATRPS
jgi:Pectate lyase superfamily protein